jgi:calmodulin
MLEKVNKQNLCEDIIEIFKIFDRDDSGYLTKTEIKIITKGLLDEQAVESFCEEADLEGEGEINYKEFLNKLLC